MPDHLHLLVRGVDDGSEFKAFMKTMRQRTAHSFKRQFGERLWQDGYFDHIVRDADAEREKIQYIGNNPVKAGLCRQPDEHPYSWWPGRSMNLASADVRSAEL